MEVWNKIVGFNQEDLDKMEEEYPRVMETIIPLSLTDVPPRNFYSWKENGLIELSQENETDDRKWVRFNLIEYVWVKSIQIMREFGFSYDIIKQVKAVLFKNIFHQLNDNIEKHERIAKEKYNLNEAELIAFNNHQRLIVETGLSMLEKNEISEMESTVIHEIITSTIMMKKQIVLLIYKGTNSFNVEVTSIGHQDKISEVAAKYKLLPHFEIPINGLISDFFNEPRSEKYAEIFGFLNPKELKVLQAIKDKDFVELIIKLDKEDELVIDMIKDGNITDEKATQIRKILGLNDYEEINLKYRNDKNLYFKNRKRIS